LQRCLVGSVMFIIDRFNLLTFTWVGAGVCTILFGWITVTNDSIPVEPPKAFSRGCFALETMSQVLRIPWIWSSDPPDCTTDNGTEGTLWIVESIGIVLDGGFLIYDGRLPESMRGDVGVVVTTIFGVGHLASAIVASIGKSGMPPARNILPVFPELAKPLRLTRVIAATKGVSLSVLAGIDFLAYTATGVIWIVEGTTVPPSRLALLDRPRELPA
jgi:hypothetical protein